MMIFSVGIMNGLSTAVSAVDVGISNVDSSHGNEVVDKDRASIAANSIYITRDCQQVFRYCFSFSMIPHLVSLACRP
jgi:hypothetical protein